MDWSVFVTAIGLLCVFEGVFPFLSPPGWRRFVLQVSSLSDRTLRVVALASMLLGLSLVCIARDFY